MFSSTWPVPSPDVTYYTALQNEICLMKHLLYRSQRSLKHVFNFMKHVSGFIESCTKMFHEKVSW